MRCITQSYIELPDFNQAPAQPNAMSYRELTGYSMVVDAPLANESALAISYNGISQAVMMVTPGHMEDFVRGFSLSTGIIKRFSEIRDIEIGGNGESHFAQVEISNRAFWDMKTQRRNLAGTTGCGLCGVEALEQALPDLVPLPSSLPPSPLVFQGLRGRIAEHQKAAKISGALHAALFANSKGEISLCREDIGRHNALDKLIGAMAVNEINPKSGFVIMTSRCSLELIHKAVRAEIATLVCLSAPTSLTVEWARRNRLNLIHLPNSSPPRLYSPAP
ncbi:formate dehydrogenase family accessory protein FdhD [Vibrio lentus]|uniref:formate dehydrogenase accessory sulfurtransferase FdhD n=1 Tax=Vibrio lentus TaxID=136468 RepID=UPI000C81CAA0|nr:formate dehydrogenase accessory sulfurtransferase FdhD [Vibrio lentus]MCC4817444.1 formate dehydrogenase accessory sulfurtransferase FdhD [Vibrio lentus]PMG72379.1 formate dehydrogenase family accessory protein FdhD [Vibrio lentus]PMK91285.1 formate dehydrogenase family accessory protein FdhD [Vibrio lentus]PML22319.1 formate dehydrogenase family accessory protein FdhD [Vibrio lentus]PMM26560.1 formate dehydrogenase family accessory protein FdhD [Vibrio lentus]